ncbi:hypothetical protein CMV_026553 [Castanea mollissima]|uniref:Uncharacterized protein n=1 Tax=Castanea mollissima TaxID=60419 RepID=A0A8J4Q7R5_9ROSI|nr:hypothetical protein CMV_026553 [Castanea mollissima]
MTNSLPQGNMRFELKRGKLIGFLVLTALCIAWSLFFTSEKMDNLTAREEEELSEAIIITQSNNPPSPWAGAIHRRELPRISQSPPPLPRGNPGPQHYCM